MLALCLCAHDAVASESSQPVKAPLGAASATFPVAVSASGRYLVGTNGKPWFMVGDAGWSSLAMLDQPQIAHYFDALASLGFNAVLVSLVEAYYSDHPPDNARGDPPFNGPLFRSEPNEAYWQWVDDYVRQAAERGITVMAVPAYLGYGNDGVADQAEQASDANMVRYGRFLGQRYRNSPNMIWVIGGDRTKVSGPLSQRMDAMAKGIRETAPQLITAHTADGASAADVYGQFPWLDINTSYNNHHRPVAEAARSWAQEPTRPVFSIEAIYEQEYDAPPGAPILRYQAYGAVLAGAFGHVFGNNPRWLFGSSKALFPSKGNWQLSLNDPGGELDRGTRQMGYFGDVFQRLPWQNLVPDTSGVFLTDGTIVDRIAEDLEEMLPNSKAAKAVGAFDAADGIAVVYTVSKSTITLDLSKLAAVPKVRVRRMDPTDASWTDIGTYPTTSKTTVAHPGSNSEGDDDWLYVVTADP